MSDNRAEQIEALEVAVPYCKKIDNALKNVIEELQGARKADTDEYIDSIVNGLNWIFEVYNGTKDLVNPGEEAIKEAEVNNSVFMLNDAMKSKSDEKSAEAFKGIKVFVIEFIDAAQKFI